MRTPGALPYYEPDRLVEIWGNVQRASVERRGASYPDFLDWRAQSRSFEDVAAFDSQWLTLVSSGPDEPERMLTEFASAQYFALLGVPPARGRVFQPDEDLVSKPAQVIVLSDGLWKRRFDADPNIVGRTVTRVAPAPYTIVGDAAVPRRLDTAEQGAVRALRGPGDGGARIAGFWRWRA